MIYSTVESLLTKHTDYDFRKNLFLNAKYLMEIEFGEFPEDCEHLFLEYVLGHTELKAVKKRFLAYFKRPQKKKDAYGKERMPLWDNKMNLYKMENLRRCILSIGTVNLMMLDFEGLWSFSSDVFLNVHKQIFGDIFPWAGEKRTVPLEKKMDFLNGRQLSFLEFDEIDPQLKDVMQRMEKLGNVKIVDDEIRNVLRELQVGVEWNDMEESEIAKKLAKIVGSLWHIHPFIEGNITVDLYYVIRFSEQKEFPISRKALYEFHRKNNIKPAIFFSSLQEEEENTEEQFLSSIFYYCMVQEKKDTFEAIPSMEGRNNLSVLIKEAEADLGIGSEDDTEDEEDNEED